MSESHARLPKEPIDRFTKAFGRFLRIEAGASGLLLLCAILAVALSNSTWSATFLSFWETPVGLNFGDLELSRSLKHWINDGLMTLFFFVVAIELKREIVLGELRNPRMAALSLAGALGGMAGPATLYLLLARGGAGAHGWGVVMTTDTAFVIGCLALLGSKVPLSLRLFLLSLAIFDDIGAILVVAIAYGGALKVWALGLAAVGVAGVALMARLGVRALPLYFLAGGALWLAIDASGVHATLTGVLLGLMTPARSWVSDTRLRAVLNRVLARPAGDHWSGDTAERKDLRRAGVAARETLSPIERLEIMLHPWVAFAVMPIFALANAGVRLTPEGLDSGVFTAVLTGLVIGKPIGVFAATFLAVQLRLAALPSTLTWPMLAAGGILTGIGFTMALFIAELAFDPAPLESAKAGILAASTVAGVCGLGALLLLARPKPVG
jgi:Na+:H+ antiporter, NhaA family